VTHNHREVPSKPPGAPLENHDVSAIKAPKVAQSRI
jgi:hypothetical protein